MFAKTTEVKFLKAWAHEEFNQISGEAHRLQDAHDVESTELAARFRVWAENEGLEMLAVSTLLDIPVDGPIDWPWSETPRRKFLDSLTHPSQCVVVL